ncbi:MAG: hypothetical protein J4452_04000 [Candidatus Aenigmarchaeota archaeon]|nr:hypothetical protein [Candidatus Aenigmarchaeota archaeon]
MIYEPLCFLVEKKGRTYSQVTLVPPVVASDEITRMLEGFKADYAQDFESTSLMLTTIGTAVDKIKALEELYPVLDHFDAIGKITGQIIERYRDLNARHEKLRHSHESLEIRHGQLSSVVDSLKSLYNTLNNRLSELNTTVGRLDSKYDSLHGSVSSLRSEVSGLRSEVSSLDSQVSSLSSQVSSLSTRMSYSSTYSKRYD